MDLIIKNRCKVLILTACAIAASASAAPAAGYKFTLRTGSGTPVCDAYVARLRAQRWPLPVRCGIPEKTSIAGFTELKRVPLSGSEIKALFPNVYWFAHNQKQAEPLIAWVPEELDFGIGKGLLAWRYDPSLSLDNNGVTDDIVVWQGATAPAHAPACGEVIFQGREEGRAQYDTQAYVLTTDGKSIDERRTRELFEHPHPNTEEHTPSGRVEHREFQELGDHVGFFEYDGVYYTESIYSTLSGDFEVKSRDTYEARGRVMNWIAVTSRREGTTQLVCEIDVRSPSREWYPLG